MNKSALSQYSLVALNGVAASLYTAEEIVKRSHAAIENPYTYDEAGLIVDSGVLDTRLGVCGMNQQCSTCGGDFLSCKGHTGSIELPFPVFHPEFMHITFACLKVICNSCYKIQPDTKYIINCVSCDAKLPSLKWIKPTTILSDGQNVTAETVKHILESADLNELRATYPVLKNYNPIDGIICTLLISSVASRPSLILKGNKTAEDDITHKYADIARTVLKYKKTNPATILESTRLHFVNLLQYHVTTLFNNATGGVPAAQHRSGKPLVGIIERIKGKSGLFRKHLAGKRINFAARAVISPSIYIDIDEVGIPLRVAKSMSKPMYLSTCTAPVILDIYDQDVACEYIKYIVIDDKKLKVMPTNKQTLRQYIVPGTLIYRSLMDGDTVLLNRNPTLQQQSVLAHRVRVMNTNTFVVHPSVCAGYAGDFDGDEMNLHVIQDVNAEIEAKALLGVVENSILLKNGTSTIGATKEVLAGLYCLTRYSDTFTSYQARALLAGAVLYKPITGVNTGRQLVSLLIPSSLTVELTAGVNTVKIVNGNIESGILNKAMIGPQGLLLHIIYNRCSTEEYAKFIKNIYILGVNVAAHYGITYGLQNILALPRKTIANDTPDLITTVKTLEKQFLQYLAENMSTSSAYILAESGAAGNKLSLVLNGLYTGYIGTGVSSKFMSMNLTHHRLLAEHGFIKTNLLGGLDSIDYYASAITGRDSLIDLFCKTATIGYTSRKLINALEEYVVRENGVIATEQGKILYLSYLNDGLDRRKIDQDLPWVNLTHYLPTSATASITTKLQITQAMALLADTHIVNNYPALFLKGCINYLLTYNYDVVTTLLKLEPHFPILLAAYKLAVAEPIGLITGLAIGEPITQINLNVKHNIGDTTLGSALDSLLEALSATKLVSLPFIKLTTTIDNKHYIDQLLRAIHCVMLPDVAKISIDYSNSVYLITMDETRMISSGITKTQIYAVCDQIGTIVDTHTKDNVIALGITTSYVEIYTLYKTLTEVVLSGIKAATCEVIIKGNHIELFMYNTSIKAAHKLLSAYDFKYTLRTNQYHALYKIYGILAVKQYLLQEMREIFLGQGLHVSTVHLQFIVAAMTCTGTLKGVSRTGIIGDKTSFLAKAGFETANKVLVKAVVNRQLDNLTSIYANVMIGKSMNAGTAKYNLRIKD